MSKFEDLKDDARHELYADDEDDVRAAAHALGYLIGHGYVDSTEVEEALEEGRRDGRADVQIFAATVGNLPPF